MIVDYKTEITEKSINTISVNIIFEEKTFNQMWKESDKRLKNSINNFYKNFIKSL